MADLPITSDDGATPVSLVDPESSNDVTVNADGSLNIKEPVSSTSTITQVTTTGTNTTLLAANASRKKAIIFIPNATVVIKLGVTASATSFTYKITSNNTTLEIDTWTGQIDALSTSGSSVNNVTELT